MAVTAPFSMTPLFVLVCMWILVVMMDARPIVATDSQQQHQPIKSSSLLSLLVGDSAPPSSLPRDHPFTISSFSASSVSSPSFHTALLRLPSAVSTDRSSLIMTALRSFPTSLPIPSRDAILSARVFHDQLEGEDTPNAAWTVIELASSDTYPPLPSLPNEDDMSDEESVLYNFIATMNHDSSKLTSLCSQAPLPLQQPSPSFWQSEKNGHTLSELYSDVPPNMWIDIDEMKAALPSESSSAAKWLINSFSRSSTKTAACRHHVEDRLVYFDINDHTGVWFMVFHRFTEDEYDITAQITAEWTLTATSTDECRHTFNLRGAKFEQSNLMATRPRQPLRLIGHQWKCPSSSSAAAAITRDVRIQNAHHSTPPEQNGKLKVMTYNVWNKDGRYAPPWDNRIQWLADNIKKSDPDIIGLQEIRHYPPTGQNLLADIIARVPGYQWTWVPAQIDPDLTEEGIAIMSKLDLLNVSFVYLGRPVGSGDGSQRAVLRGRVQSSVVGELDFFVSHISWDRNPQIDHVAKIIDFTNSNLQPGVSQVFLADLNTYPGFEQPAQCLTGESACNGRSSNWTEAYQGVITFPTPNPPDRYGRAQTRCDRIYFRWAPDVPALNQTSEAFPVQSSSPSLPSSSLLLQRRLLSDDVRRRARVMIRFNGSDTHRSGAPVDPLNEYDTCPSDHFSVETSFTATRSLDCTDVPCKENGRCDDCRCMRGWCGANAFCDLGEQADGLCQCQPGYVPFDQSVPFNHSAPPKSAADDVHPLPPRCVPSCLLRQHCFAQQGHGRCTQPNNCTCEPGWLLPDCERPHDVTPDKDGSDSSSFGSWGSVTSIVLISLPVVVLFGVCAVYRRWRRKSQSGAYGLTGSNDDSEHHQTMNGAEGDEGVQSYHDTNNRNSPSSSTLPYARVAASSIYDPPSVDTNITVEMSREQQMEMEAHAAAAQVGIHHIKQSSHAHTRSSSSSSQPAVHLSHAAAGDSLIGQ